MYLKKRFVEASLFEHSVSLKNLALKCHVKENLFFEILSHTQKKACISLVSYMPVFTDNLEESGRPEEKTVSTSHFFLEYRHLK